MSKPPSFQFYAQDFLTGVMYLTNEEVGMYIKMLAKQWTDNTIPKKRLGFLVGHDWSDLSEELRSKFEDCGEYVINTRLEEERDKKERFLEKQRENGKKGGRPPKEEKPNINPTLTQKKPLEDEKEIEYKGKGGVGEKPKTDFNELLDFINRTTGRKFKTINGDVRKKYRARLKEGYSIDEIKNAVCSAVKQKYHIENGNQYLTPEFFSRGATLEKYASKTKNGNNHSNLNIGEIDPKSGRPILFFLEDGRPVIQGNTQSPTHYNK